MTDHDTEAIRPRPRRAAVVRGVGRALPIVVGYVPIGFAYGVLAQQAGLSLFNTLAMSVLVYAGAAQLIAVALFSASAPAPSIIATTFIVNLRHMLFSAALAPYLQGWPKRYVAAFAYELTDESFALHSAQFPLEVPPKAEILALNGTAQLAWVLGGFLGALAGGWIVDVQPLALDYTLAAMFIALLVMQIRAPVEVVVAALTGLLAVGLTLWGMGRWSVIAATLIGASLGVVLERFGPRSSSASAQGSSGERR